VPSTIYLHNRSYSFSGLILMVICRGLHVYGEILLIDKERIFDLGLVFILFSEENSEKTASTVNYKWITSIASNNYTIENHLDLSARDVAIWFGW
jgi:hypothetical protein